MDSELKTREMPVNSTLTGRTHEDEEMLVHLLIEVVQGPQPMGVQVDTSMVMENQATKELSPIKFSWTDQLLEFGFQEKDKQITKKSVETKINAHPWFRGVEQNMLNKIKSFFFHSRGYILSYCQETNITYICTMMADHMELLATPQHRSIDGSVVLRYNLLMQLRSSRMMKTMTIEAASNTVLNIELFDVT